MTIGCNGFRVGNLKLVRCAADAWTDRTPAIGDRVRLASGGPILLVVDVAPKGQRVTVAWREGNLVREQSLFRACLLAAL